MHIKINYKGIETVFNDNTWQSVNYNEKQDLITIFFHGGSHMDIFKELGVALTRFIYVQFLKSLKDGKNIHCFPCELNVKEIFTEEIDKEIKQGRRPKLLTWKPVGEFDYRVNDFLVECVFEDGESRKMFHNDAISYKEKNYKFNWE
jgi:hypothetical protein